MTKESTGYKPGLEGVVAAETRLSSVDGQKGELIISGYLVEELALHATFEETCYLLWYDRLPNESELSAFKQSLAARRALPAATLALLVAVAEQKLPAMDALRIAAGTLDLDLGGEQTSVD